MIGYDVSVDVEEEGCGGSVVGVDRERGKDYWESEGRIVEKHIVERIYHFHHWRFYSDLSIVVMINNIYIVVS